MRGLPHHLASLLIAAVLAMGTTGLRAVHVALGFAPTAAPGCCTPQRAHGAHDGHAPATGDCASKPCAPAHPHACGTCEQIDAIAATAQALDGACGPCQLIAVLDQPAPAAQHAPSPPRSVGARPPPTA